MCVVWRRGLGRGIEECGGGGVGGGLARLAAFRGTPSALGETMWADGCTLRVRV